MHSVSICKSFNKPLVVGNHYMLSMMGFYCFCLTVGQGFTNLTQLNTTYLRSLSLTKPFPAACQAWQAGGNTAVKYGPIIAYPAARLTLSCVVNATGFTKCNQSDIGMEASTVEVAEFWITSKVDIATRKPVSTLPVGAALLDMAGQVMHISELILRTAVVLPF